MKPLTGKMPYQQDNFSHELMMNKHYKKLIDFKKKKQGQPKFQVMSVVKSPGLNKVHMSESDYQSISKSKYINNQFIEKGKFE
jgi:hypothetical protein